MAQFSLNQEGLGCHVSALNTGQSFGHLSDGTISRHFYLYLGGRGSSGGDGGSVGAEALLS